LSHHKSNKQGAAGYLTIMAFHSILRIPLLALAIWLAVGACAMARAAGEETDSVELRFQLEMLAREYGFKIGGLEFLSDTTVDVPPGDLTFQLSRLLVGYSYILSSDADGDPRMLKILGKKGTAPTSTARQYRIKTTRKGTAHYIDAVIMGNGPERIHFKLLVDTGASMLVLPSSVAEVLGYSENDLETVEFQTTNGKVSGEFTVLSQVEVGQAVRNDIKVAFVDDEKLGDNFILGMAFLNGYSVTIDDAQNMLFLKETEKEDPGSE